jgi:hypothetical protein
MMKSAILLISVIQGLFWQWTQHSGTAQWYSNQIILGY